MVSDCVFPLFLLSFNSFYSYFFSLACLFCKENREVGWGGGSDLRGEGGGKIMIKMYCIYCMVLKKGIISFKSK